MNDAMLSDSLLRYFGYQTFRPGQKEIIRRLLDRKNVLGILTTGGGKSITYQLPAMLLPGITLVISPLISLMVDQVHQLKRKGWRNVAYLNSALEAEESKRVLASIQQGSCKLLYISPEKVHQRYIQQILKKRGVSLIAIDEAHCISQWGHDFRTDYLRLTDVVEELGFPPVLAVTATATHEVQQEICRLFCIEKENVIALSVNRPNIALDVIEIESDMQKQAHLIELIKKLQPPGIVYCSTRQTVDQLVAACHLEGLHRVHAYHGGLSAMERMLLQEQFMSGQLDVMIATNAFGMGIDKSDIRFVLHYHFPPSMEAYTQEIGRIGRDGQEGYAALYLNPDDSLLHYRMMEYEHPTNEQIGHFLSHAESAAKSGTGKIEPGVAMQEMEISETVLRCLFFYAEMAGVLSVMAITKDAIQYAWSPSENGNAFSFMADSLARTKESKLKKLWSMQAWMSEPGCLRSRLLAYFGEEKRESQDNCCAHCGIDINRYLLTTLIRVENRGTWDLQDALQKLLPARSSGQGGFTIDES